LACRKSGSQDDQKYFPAVFAPRLLLNHLEEAKVHCIELGETRFCPANCPVQRPDTPAPKWYSYEAGSTSRPLAITLTSTPSSSALLASAGESPPRAALISSPANSRIPSRQRALRSARRFTHGCHRKNPYRFPALWVQVPCSQRKNSLLLWAGNSLSKMLILHHKESQTTRRIGPNRQNSLQNSLLTGNSAPETGPIRTACSVC
jgi:hypothetical protein